MADMMFAMVLFPKLVTVPARWLCEPGLAPASRALLLYLYSFSALF